MRRLIVTAADEGFMPLLRSLMGSIERCGLQPSEALACLDVGMSAESRAWAARHAAQVVEPGWDLPVGQGLRERQPHLRALTGRPFLREHFPGYDVYLWIDADAWVQERFALDWLFEAAAGGALAAVPQVDRAYRHDAGLLGWRMGRMEHYFGRAAGVRSLWDTYVNSGVFALRADAPHWQAWAGQFRRGLQASGGALCCDQTALNHALWEGGLPLHPLPALCNWLCHLAMPVVDPVRGRFCEPFAPRRVLGIVHAAGKTKDVAVRVSGENGSRAVALRFPGPMAEAVPR